MFFHRAHEALFPYSTARLHTREVNVEVQVALSPQDQPHLIGDYQMAPMSCGSYLPSAMAFHIACLTLAAPTWGSVDRGRVFRAQPDGGNNIYHPVSEAGAAQEHFCDSAAITPRTFIKKYLASIPKRTWCGSPWLFHKLLQKDKR